MAYNFIPQDPWEETWEPSEFQDEIDALVSAVKNSVPKEIKDRLEFLEDFYNENASVVKELDLIKRHYETMLKEAKHRNTLELEIEKEKLKKGYLIELLDEAGREVWDIAWEMKVSKPCGKCDENHNIHYKTPLGRDAIEQCDCYKTWKHYRPISLKLYEVDKANDGIVCYYRFRDKMKPEFHYLEYFGDYSYEDDKFKSNKYIIQDEEDIDSYRLYESTFSTVELAEKYCEIKNKEEMEKINK